ncbi:hypothetical protein SELMODRAFT_90358 [Selaginella moellendorffii]|uniref:Chaperonin 10 n=1 Tax=Selaginella moellendorffii TaxID=88036 RepID=D8RD27_SELML|nr:10 kDa chaperonin [Selaginella moellendorffii]XP_002973938.1 10 kDa chaperonin [Selaginella moellendorffii]EFJ24893.1 hypothetical protein SELMODRAFT_100218 [Selaginella moellendorffii]EFJ30242.1 hypothetical protein SELMODRAFT_90358 [Selaginella moellendorffii]|eukprot:XP_002969126.1 10 kDa chaperonin [Selaginella moellendorffii]
MAAFAKLAPLLDRVLVEKFIPPAASMGGVLLPDSLTKYNSGTVIATGKRRLRDGQMIPLCVKEGDEVLLPEHGGKVVKLGQKEYTLYREEELLGILVDDDSKK